MAIRKAQQALGLIFYQRCFYLCILLLAFDAVVPFVEFTSQGKFATNVLNSLIVVCAVAAVGRTVLSFVIVCLLALAALTFYWLSFEFNDITHLAWAWGFGAALDLATITYLLVYGFRPEVMTADKLCGAAASYLMMGSLWATLYALVNLFYPGSFVNLGEEHNSELMDFLYFSNTVLTSTGFGDIVPKTRQARALCNLEQLAGAMYVAILIARLAGVYPPVPPEEERKRDNRLEPTAELDVGRGGQR